MTKAPNNAKEIESFADPLFEKKMKEYNVNGSSFVVVHDGKVKVLALKPSPFLQS